MASESEYARVAALAAEPLVAGVAAVGALSTTLSNGLAAHLLKGRTKSH